MDLRSLNIFIQVAELGSFTRAGEKLGYSQPTVSFQIKQLEQELGAPLFDRIGHTVSLTEPGRDALHYAQQICRLSQKMSLDTSKRYEPTGVLRLAMADSLCTPLIARHFAMFRKSYPHVSLEITTAGTGELFRLLDHNEVDMVCTLDSQVCDTTYIVTDEERVGVHFVAAPENPLVQFARIDPETLTSQSFLLTEKGMSYRRLLDEHLARMGLEIHPVLEIGSADLICKLVQQNMGISFLPDYVTEDALRNGRLVRLPVEDIHVELWKQILHRREKWVSLPMQAMIRHLSRIRISGNLSGISPVNML